MAKISLFTFHVILSFESSPTEPDNLIYNRHFHLAPINTAPLLQLGAMDERLVPRLIPSLPMNRLQVFVSDRFVRVIPLGYLGRDFD